MNTADLQEIFRAGLNELALPEASLAPRRQAMAAFARHGFPTRKDEDWRYTDLKPILRGGFDPRPRSWNESHRAQVLERLADLDLDAHAPRLVFVDGQRLTGARLSEAPPGVDIYDQNQAWDRIGSLQTAEQFRAYPLAALNTAFASSCTLIRVEPDVRVDETLHLVFLDGAAANRSTQVRLLIDLEHGSRLRVVQHFASRDTAGWTQFGDPNDPGGGLRADVVPPAGTRRPTHAYRTRAFQARSRFPGNPRVRGSWRAPRAQRPQCRSG